MVIKTRFNVGEEVMYGAHKEPFKVFSIEIYVGKKDKNVNYLVQSQYGFIRRVRENDLIKMQVSKHEKPCLRDKEKKCNECHECDIDVLNPNY